MTRVKLNLVSGSVQEREVVTAFTSNGIKYIIFDGESTGSMGLPIILVSKEDFGKVVGITDAEEWKNTKECLKKIISGEKVEYASVDGELKADDIYYRQLTLPIASFDILKSSYEVPVSTSLEADNNNAPVFEQITPEDIAGSAINNVEPVMPSSFNDTSSISPFAQEPASIPVVNEPVSAESTVQPAMPLTGENVTPVVQEPSISNELPSQDIKPDNYEEMKKEFLAGAEELFNNIYNKLNH